MLVELEQACERSAVVVSMAVVSTVQADAVNRIRSSDFGHPSKRDASFFGRYHVLSAS
jgi:hypothetical protein